MNVPILSARRAQYRKQVEDDAMQKAVGAVKEAMEWSGVAEKGFLNGNAALMGNTGMGGSATMLSAQAGRGASGGSLSRALEARVTQNLASGFARAPEELELALAEQGMSWNPPFPPGRPLDPNWGYRRPPRTWDYSVGENVQISPRWNRISFNTIQSIWESYDVAMICTQHLINDVRSLTYNWEPIPGIKADVSKDIEAAIRFFDMPDKRLPFRAWLAKWLQDVIKFDAGALYIRRNNADEPIALEVISGKTILPLVDYYGRRPEDEHDETEDPEGMFGGEIVPAYTQIIEGMPWDMLAADDLLYIPWNPEPDSQYGRAPLERVLLSANTDIRFQWHFLNFFTEGTVPAGFMEAPPDMSDPAQVAHWQEVWDAVMQGDQTKQTQIRWVPNGSKFTGTKDDANKFDKDFPLYLMRRTCAAHGTTPSDLGFTEEVNKATGDTQVDVQFRVGTTPLLRHVEDVINLFVREHLKLKCRLNIDDGKETEDRVATAMAAKVDIEVGALGVDERRMQLGLHVDKSRPMPRYVLTRVGPIPLLSLESMAGKIDPETYGPADDQPPVNTPFSEAPGPVPPKGSPEEKLAAEHTAQQARDLIEATTGEMPPAPPPAPGEPPAPTTTKAVVPATKTEPPGEDVSAEDESEEGEAGKAASNMGGPGVTGVTGGYAGDGAPTTIVGGTDGITVQTGVQGEDLLDDEEDDEDDEATKALVAFTLRRWRDSSRNRLKKGRAPRRFVDPNLPAAVHDEVWAKLQAAKTREAVDEAFADVVRPKALAGISPETKPAVKAKRPPFHHNADAIVEHYAPLIAKALGEMFSSSDLDAAVAAGVAAKKKPVEKSAGPPPHLRASENSLARCANCCLANNPKCVKYGDWDVKPDWTCDGWEIAIPEVAKAEAVDAVKAAVVGVLSKAKANVGKLKDVLTSLYGDSFLTGAHDAAQAAGGSVVASLKDVSESVPKGYWDAWTPGFGAAAEAAADGGMRAMLDKAEITIQGLSETSIDRIGGMVSEGLSKGDSIQTVGKDIRDVLEDPARSETVANTEMARATSAASEQTYGDAGITQVEWLAEDDACPDCEALAADSPLDLGSDSPPDHPNCRCAIAPVVDLGTPDSGVDSGE
jgi:SPP1 gp7 family putative phage head morphogenesis protein